MIAKLKYSGINKPVVSPDDYTVERQVCGSFNAMTSGNNPSRIDKATTTTKFTVAIHCDLPAPIANYRFLTTNDFVSGWSGEGTSTARRPVNRWD